MEGADVTYFVGFDQGEGRTFYCANVPQATNDAPRQSGFAHAQVAFEKNQAVAPGNAGDPCAKVAHGLFIGQVQGYFRHGACSSNN